MGWILKLLGGSLGPYFAGGIAALLALSVATTGVQSFRLAHAKSDLAQARQALLNPSTHNTWQSEAVRDGRDLGTCTDKLTAQNAAVAARSAEDARKLADATKGMVDARAVAESYRRSAPTVRAYQPKGPDACARALDVDAMILGDLAR